jgi:hypothetical protein
MALPRWLAGSASFCVLTCATMTPGIARAEITTEQLQKEIEQRDAIIRRLAQRVESLEREMKAHRPAAHVASNAPRAAPKPPVVAPSAAAEAAPPVRVSVAASPQTVARISTSPVAATAPGAVRGPTEEEIARALENTLINQGGLLLAPGVKQFVPDLGVVYSDQYQLAFIAPGVIPGTTSTGIFTVELGLGFRIGLPWGMQGSVRLPFDWSEGQARFGGTTSVSSTKMGIGDVSFGLQKQLVYEDATWPAVIVNGNYKAATGSSNLQQVQISTFSFAAGTGSGFPTFSGGITLQKRQDPLVFLGNVEYYHNFPAKIAGVNEKLGDVVELRLSPILAASPDTSLRVAWDTFFQADNTVAGQRIKGSSQTISFLEFGVGSNLSAHWFMDASVGIGLTRDSPDFRALVQFPFRF